jgi:uncharacterized membrane protein HdeD (DUF308 family)
MTEPRTGPPGPSAPAASGSASASAQAAAPQAAVPQQYEPQQYEPGREVGDETAEQGVPADTVLAAAARKSWAAVLIGGLGMIGLGICLLVWPHASLTVVAILIGAALVVSGIVRLYEGFTASQDSGAMRTAYVVVGLLAILAGLYCLRHHALSLFLVAFVVGVYFIVHGLADLGVALSGRVPARGLRAVLGVFSLAAGIIMVIWPAITVVLLLTIVAAWLLFYGLMLCGLAFSLRRMGKAESTGRAQPTRLTTSTG